MKFFVNEEIKRWLLTGDPSICYLAYRDLFMERFLKDHSNLIEVNHLLAEKRNQIPLKGWGRAYLSRRGDKGHWGQSFYQPKWISSHYTLLELKNIGCPPTKEIMETIEIILTENIGPDGGVNPSKDIGESDVCINGMFLNYATYFGVEEEKLKGIVDYIIKQHMADGGFNCRKNRSGAVHSSLHSTISVLEGIHSYVNMDYRYRMDELIDIEKQGIEFMLMHRLYKSDHTGEIINKSMTMLSYPSRWKYDVLRAMVFMAEARVPYDQRMKDALLLIVSKKRKDNKWPVQAKHQGKVFFEMEKTGGASRMNTYRALKVLKKYGKEIDYGWFDY